jgi:hypothetical protein
MSFYGTGLVEKGIAEIDSWEVVEETDAEEFKVRVLDYLRELVETDGGNAS